MTADHAPAIAAHLLARAANLCAIPDPDFLGTVHDRWPGASHDEARRGLLIANELIEADLAQLRATAPPPRPEPDAQRRAEIVAGIAAILMQVSDIEAFPSAMHRIGQAYPDLTSATLLDGMGLAGPMWPEGEGDAP